MSNLDSKSSAPVENEKKHTKKTTWQPGKTVEYINTDISLSFLCMHYPKKLIKHLTKNRHLKVEKSAPGGYYIIKEIFSAQIIVTRELPHNDSLYLRCITDKELIGNLADDYDIHKEQDIYINYMDQVTTANTNINTTTKGDSTMVCEGLFRLYDTEPETFNCL